jgi:hypothetical protein
MTAVVIVKIYADLDPLDRYERYHKPLDAALAARGLGEVTGGGTMMDLDSGDALYSDLHVRVDGDLDLALGAIRTALVRCGIPAGSDLCVDGANITIGVDAH